MEKKGEEIRKGDRMGREKGEGSVERGEEIRGNSKGQQQKLEFGILQG